MANSRKLLAAFAGALALAASLPAHADWSLLNMPEGVSEL